MIAMTLLFIKSPSPEALSFKHPMLLNRRLWRIVGFLKPRDRFIRCILDSWTLSYAAGRLQEQLGVRLFEIRGRKAHLTAARPALLLLFFTALLPAAETAHLSIDASKAGAKIDRNLFGQLAENLGHGLY